ncbi:MAG TPA: alpha/beta hydrolase [Cytophagales bacterium]|nr:alpha/beta hydrolase [Cytophagales bacterium]HAP60443.1 alpha/beta hydrolase [Cytophagales bacterium]
MTNSANTQVRDYSTDPQIDRGTKEFLKALNTGGGPALETLSKEDARQVLVGAQEAFEVDLSGIEETEKTIAADGYTVRFNIVRPTGNAAKLPAFIYVHGGGWILGDYPTHKRMVRELVVRTGAVGVFVNYTPSPEAQFPTAINEIYAATKWVADHGDEINVDGSKLGIIGNSVGGNMATVTTLKAKEDGRRDMIKVQVLLWPVTDASFSQASYQAYAEDRFLTTSIMKWMWDQYTTDARERKSKYASPLQASLQDLEGLPTAFIHVAESDILRDEGEAYGVRLDEAGVPVTTVRYNGMIHDWGLLHALKDLPTTVSMFDNAALELKKFLF